MPFVFSALGDLFALTGDTEFQCTGTPVTFYHAIDACHDDTYVVLKRTEIVI